jgi:Cu/Ag efflux protein CusF
VSLAQNLLDYALQHTLRSVSAAHNSADKLKREDEHMVRLAESRFVFLAVFMVLGLAAAGSVMAQAQQSTSPLAGAPPADKMNVGMLEGSVEKVDPNAGTIHVSSRPLGVLGQTIEVTDWTQIQVEGRQGTLSDIREGATVKAAYESYEGKNVATRIDVMPAQNGESGRPPAKSQ